MPRVGVLFPPRWLPRWYRVSLHFLRKMLIISSHQKCSFTTHSTQYSRKIIAMPLDPISLQLLHNLIIELMTGQICHREAFFELELKNCKSKWSPWIFGFRVRTLLGRTGLQYQVILVRTVHTNVQLGQERHDDVRHAHKSESNRPLQFVNRTSEVIDWLHRGIWQLYHYFRLKTLLKEFINLRRSQTF